MATQLPPGTRIQPCSWMTGLDKGVLQDGVLYASPALVFRLGMGDDVKVLELPAFDPAEPLPMTTTTTFDMENRCDG
jgi:hypothetical protein